MFDLINHFMKITNKFHLNILIFRIIKFWNIIFINTCGLTTGKVGTLSEILLWLYPKRRPLITLGKHTLSYSQESAQMLLRGSAENPQLEEGTWNRKQSRATHILWQLARNYRAENSLGERVPGSRFSIGHDGQYPIYSQFWNRRRVFPAVDSRRPS